MAEASSESSSFAPSYQMGGEANGAFSGLESSSMEKLPKISLRERVFLTFTEPSSSKFAYCISFYFDALVALSMLVMCAESVVAWSQTAEQQRTWFVLETVLTFNFLADFLIKTGSAKPLLRYVLTRPTFSIDLLSLSPYFIELIYENLYDDQPSIKALRVLRMFRFLRITRIAYESLPDVRLFLMAVRKSRLAIAFLSMYVFGAGLFFATCLYFAETSECTLIKESGFLYYNPLDLPKESLDRDTVPKCQIQNMFDAWWFTLVTMTTVGYGDVVVRSVWSRMITVGVMICSLIFLALPAAIFSANLMEMYLDRRLSRSRKGGFKGHEDEDDCEHEGSLFGSSAVIASASPPSSPAPRAALSLNQELQSHRDQLGQSIRQLSLQLSNLQRQQGQLDALLKRDEETASSPRVL